jgi:hypothetical protein
MPRPPMPKTRNNGKPGLTSGLGQLPIRINVTWVWLCGVRPAG